MDQSPQSVVYLDTEMVNTGPITEEIIQSTCSRCGFCILNGFYQKKKVLCTWCMTVDELFFVKENSSICLINNRVISEDAPVKFMCLFCQNLNEKIGIWYDKILNYKLFRTNPFIFTLDITKSNTSGYFISAFGSLFLFSVKVCPESNRIHFSVQLLVDYEHSYSFIVDVKKNDLLLVNRGYATHITDMKLDTMLSIQNITQKMGGFEDITFTLIITQDDKKDIKSLEALKELCVSVNKYCSDLEVCRKFKRGCNAADIIKKREKHELLYCPFGSYCQFCLKDMSSTGDILESHYEADHNICEAGCAWRAATDQYLGGLGGNFLLKTSVGIAVCVYREYRGSVKFAVYTSLQSDELEKYSCEIKLRDALSKIAIDPFRLWVYYDEIYDWYVEVQPDKYFMNWSGELEITVSIIKNENSM